MGLSEIEIARAKKMLGEFIERRRPPPHMRHQVDLGYRVSGQSVEIFELRPAWNRPSEKMETPVAKATFIRTQNVWRVYWQRADLKWHLYEPVPEVAGLSDFLSVLEEDPHGCFWGEVPYDRSVDSDTLRQGAARRRWISCTSPQTCRSPSR